MDDWRKGDLALCVRSGTETRAGHVYTVRAVYLPYVHIFEGGKWWRTDELSLDFYELPWKPGSSSGASRFRKIHPHTPDAEDAETIRLMGGKPVKQPA